MAKHWCHGTVDDRHVFLAIAAELSLSVPDGIDEVLVPRGESVTMPTFDEEAEIAGSFFDRDTSCSVSWLRGHG